ncbi:rhodanese-like domain-containing protein [Cohnella massiliensis]|uniref:rhodanese-like domain-containing protein n=1 Tax=Cohnella massiliensis TaxID=1816691 RepID=UPI0009BC3104
MITLLYILAGAVILWVLRVYWPVPWLRYVQGHEWLDAARNNLNMKILDVRDAFDYQERHFPGSINISLGRLPYVWHQELSTRDDVLILSASRYQSNKAARILHKRGFRQLHAIRGNFLQLTCKEENKNGSEFIEHGYNH